MAGLFAIAFVAGAVLVFSIPGGAGALIWPGEGARMTGVVVVAALLFLLAVVDVVAMVRGTYCPLSWRRQTPKWLMRRGPWPFVAAAWGLDTGLFFTTFRVAAIGWGAMILTALRPAEAWHVGLAYGLGFALPFFGFVAAWRMRVVRAEGDAPRRLLEGMLAQRRRLQLISAAALMAAAAALTVAVLKDASF